MKATSSAHPRQPGVDRTLPHRGVPGRHELDGTQELNGGPWQGHRRHRLRGVRGARVRPDSRSAHLAAGGGGGVQRLTRQAKLYDVCIVGSGAGGGWRLHAHPGRRRRGGARSGRAVDNAKDSAMLTWPYESPRRGRSTRTILRRVRRCIGGWELPANRTPGRRHRVRVGGPLAWWAAGPIIGAAFPCASGRTISRARVGRPGATIGRFPTTTWHRTTTAWTAGRDLRQQGEPPQRAERRVSAAAPPPLPRAARQTAADRLHVTCIPARLSILTRALNGRAACHYCGQCNRGCKVNANFTSTNVLIAPRSPREAHPPHERDGARSAG